MRRPRPIILSLALALNVALPLWLAWSLKGPDTIPVTAAQSVPPGFIWGVSSSGFQS